MGATETPRTKASAHAAPPAARRTQMKLPRPLLAAVIAASAAVLAPVGAHAQVANPWTFTTAAWTPRVAAAPSTVADSIAFDVVANGGDVFASGQFAALLMEGDRIGRPTGLPVGQVLLQIGHQAFGQSRQRAGRARPCPQCDNR